ncbi:hypothetical protein GC174_16005 [bacterium]|nr:hypothetical protein [bacterium]
MAKEGGGTRWQLEIGTEKEGPWLRYFVIDSQGTVKEMRFNDEPMVQPQFISTRKISDQQLQKLKLSSRCLEKIQGIDPSKAPNQAPLLVWRIKELEGALTIDKKSTCTEVKNLYRQVRKAVDDTRPIPGAKSKDPVANQAEHNS